MALKELIFEVICFTLKYIRKSFFRLLKLKYDQHAPDVVVCSDDQSLNFMQVYGQELFRNAPIVFCWVSGYQPEMHKNQNIADLIDSIEIEATLARALRLQPATRTVAVI